MSNIKQIVIDIDEEGKIEEIDFFFRDSREPQEPQCLRDFRLNSAAHNLLSHIQAIVQDISPVIKRHRKNAANRNKNISSRARAGGSNSPQ